MNRVFRGRRPFIFLAVILFILGGAALSRPAIAIYNQGRAGDLLAKATQSYPDLTACEIPILTDTGDYDQLETVVKLLEQAVRYAPQSSQSYLLLGQTYCLRGQPEQAVDAFKTYNQLRPKNPLGRLELGFARYYLCASNEQQGGDRSSTSAGNEGILFCQDQTLLERIRANWRVLGVDSDQFLSKARQSFEQKNYADANLWYQRVLKFQPGSLDELPSYDQFKWAVSAVLAGQFLPALLTEHLPIFELAQPLTITGDQLRFRKDIPEYEINYGDLIQAGVVDDHLAGFLYFKGPVGVFINVPADGLYQISVQALNTPAAPVVLQLENDFEPFGKIELERGDQSWQVDNLKVYLEKGIHLLDINYVSDGGGDKRYAVIDWIKIEQED